MQVMYILHVNSEEQVEPRFRHLFSGREKLPYGRYEIKFGYKQLNYEREVQDFLRAHPKVEHKLTPIRED